jgi:MarR family transcriptional regulator, organic hydroperoxide resistance regulator
MASQPVARSSSSPANALDGATDFARALEDFFRATRRARARLRPGEEPLSISQYHLLEPLGAADDARAAGELALAAGVTPPTATRTLDGLERAGLVRRRRAEHDRRCVHVELTDEGRRAVEDKRHRLDARRAEIFASLAPDDRAGAAALLRRVGDVIEGLR